MRKLPFLVTPMALLQPLAASPAPDSPPRVHPEIEAWAIRAAASNGFGGDLRPAPHGRASPSAPQRAGFVDLSDPMASAVVRARRYVRRAVALFRLLRRRARHAAELRQLQSLDNDTLRDLGLTRSEIGSVYAESVGDVAATRRPIVEHEWYRLRAGVPVGHGAAL
jgi:uncharacterized protein YjiS (DUF1127 family)